jgi:predicted transcriptional regulator
MNLTDAEMLIMNLVWQQGELKASQIAEIMILDRDWKKNTTYTLIKRLEKKGALLRTNPGYICKPLIEIEDTRIKETRLLLDKVYNGSFKLLVQNFINNEELSNEEIEEIKKMIEEVKK